MEKNHGRQGRHGRQRRRNSAGGQRFDPIESVEPEFDEAPIDDLVRQAARGGIDISEL